MNACYAQKGSRVYLQILSFRHHWRAIRGGNEAGIEREDAPLTGNDDSLAGAISAHGSVGVLRDGEQVRLKLASAATVVCLYDFWAIEGDALEGVDGDEDNSGICIDAMLGVTIANCVKDWRKEFEGDVERARGGKGD